MDEVKAQDAFAAWLRDTIAPALRTRGFIGSGQTFELRDSRYWAVLGFQKSRYSRADELEFTINVAVIGRPDWESLREQIPGLGKRPAPTDFRYAGALRLDQLPGVHQDPWWQVRPGMDTSELTGSLLTAIDEAVLPWMHARIGRAAHSHATAVASVEPELLV